MESVRKDVLCLGLIGADYVTAPIARWPDPGTLIRTPGLTLTVGGCAGNISIDLAKLNVPVGIVSRVGKDLHGDFLRKELESHGVCCEALTVSDTRKSSSTVVVNVRGEDRRFIHDEGACAEQTGLEISDEMLGECRILCVAGLGLNRALTGENVAAIFRRARARGVLTVLDVVFSDPEFAWSMVRQALPETDIFLPNTDEVRFMTGLTDVNDQAECLLRAGAQTVVVTLGGDGAVVLDQVAGRIRVGAYPGEVVDGTGSGDAFDAGYIYGLLKSATLLQCLAYGSAMGASCIRSVGATTGVFNSSELEAFVAQHPLPVLSRR